MADVIRVKFSTTTPIFNPEINAEGARASEVARILRFLADRVEDGTYDDGRTDIAIWDGNEEEIGRFVWDRKR